MAVRSLETEKQDVLGADANQYLTFSLGNEEYGVDILKVQEIKGYTVTTRIPNSPHDVVGVLNLRGTIVPIVDLRRKFGLDTVEYDQFTAVVVMVVQNRVMGMIVDSVSEVMNIPASSVQPPPDFGGIRSNMLQGMAKMGEKFITLLDIDAVLAEECGAATLAMAA